MFRVSLFRADLYLTFLIPTTGFLLVVALNLCVYTEPARRGLVFLTDRGRDCNQQVVVSSGQPRNLRSQIIKSLISLIVHIIIFLARKLQIISVKSRNAYRLEGF